MRSIWLLILLCISLKVCAQLPDNSLENLLESAPENADPEEVIQQLLYYKQHPLNLNAASAEELSTPGLFTLLQANAILEHRKKYGSFIAPEELQAVKGMDLNTLHRIKNFCTVSPVLNAAAWKPENVFANGKNMILLRSRRLFGAPVNAGYAGDNYGHSLAWRYTSGNKLDAGFNADKDPGETYGSKGRLPGMDSWNYHIFLRPGGSFRALAIGDYQLNCGQGLVVWTGFAGSKGPDVLNVQKLGPVLRPYTAFGEYGNYRGVALTAGGKKLTISTWFSSKKLDSDLDGNYFHSISNGGYHRTVNEISKRGNLNRTFLGFNIKYATPVLNQEITIQRSRYNAIQQKGDQPYQYYEPAGNSAFHAAYAYSAGWRNVRLAGEVAADYKSRLAYLNTLLVSADSKLAFSVLHRHLGTGYYSPTADPFRENSQPVNEDGIYTGLQWQVFPKIKLSAFADYFHFSWLRYQSDRPSSGKEWLLQSTWAPSRNSELYLRFRSQVKEENAETAEGLMQLKAINKCNLRADARLKLSADIFFQMRTEWTRLKELNRKVNDGWLLFEEIDFRPMGRRWNLTLRYSVYSTANYDSRIYAFEQELPGSYSLPAYAGAGTSSYLLLRWKFRKGLDAWFRLGTEKSKGEDAVRTWSPGVQFRWIFD